MGEACVSPFASHHVLFYPFHDVTLHGATGGVSPSPPSEFPIGCTRVFKANQHPHPPLFPSFDRVHTSPIIFGRPWPP